MWVLSAPTARGKTTFFNCLSCLYRPTDGQIEFENTPLVPVTSSATQRRIRIFAVIFMVAGILRLPLFWSLFLPQTFFKVEVFLLGIFILSIRFLLVRGIMAFEIWAWGLMYVFLLSDLAFALWFLTHTSGMMLLLNIPLYFFSVPWSVGAGALGVYLMVVAWYFRRTAHVRFQAGSGCGLPHGHGAYFSKYPAFF